MKKVKRFVNILVIAYLIFALLIIFNILNREVFISTFGQNNLEGFYSVMFFLGCALLFLQLITSALHMKAVSRERQLDQLKITELKAKLYDQKQDYRDNRPGQSEYGTSPNEGQTVFPPSDETDSNSPYPRDTNKI